jgi:ElaB/YqjD/DUF883 family membrane-anchored ribosome-binding protein
MNDRIEKAKREADRARQQFIGTLDSIEDKLNPAALADHAWSGVVEKGSEIADEAITAVKNRPAAAAGVVAALGLFLARGRIISAASRLVSRKEKRGSKRD